MKREMKIIGTEFDDEKYNKLKSNWNKTIHGDTFCPLHKTFFFLIDDEQQEPCWACYNSCVKYL